MYGHYLRHSRAGDYTCRTDRSGADADLDSIDTSRDQFFCALGSCNITGNKLHFREFGFDLFYRVDNANAMPVRGIDHDRISAGSDQRFAPLEKITGCADSGCAPQSPEVVLGRVRKLDRLLNVVDRDQTLKVSVVIHYQ